MTGQAPDGSSSALLRCLSQLNSDTFAEVLLPKLIEQGSSGSVALTCSQLRSLCQHSVQELNLTAVPSSSRWDASTVEAWTAALPEHFPNCTSVKLATEDEERSYHNNQYLLMTLGRLPKLCSIDLDVQEPSHTVPLAMLLCSLRTHLSSLQSLKIIVHHSWSGAAPIWQELGKVTPLTSLFLDFTNKGTAPCAPDDMRALAGLTNLQSLVVASQRTGPHDLQEQTSYAFLRALTSLTELCLGWCAHSGIANMGSCTALCNLELVWYNDGPTQELTFEPAEWGALAQLTNLTSLQLPNVHVDASGPCCSALVRLTKLHNITACRYVTDVLPTLSQLTALDYIAGGWVAGDAAASSGAVCQHVDTLIDTHGDVPFQAFPGLKGLCHCQGVLASAWACMHQHCPGLQAIELSDPTPAGFSVYATQSLQRVAAVHSLAGLTQLTRLEFSPEGDADMAALATAAATLVRTNLVLLDVRFSNCSKVHHTGLMHLARLSGLRTLALLIGQLPFLAAPRATRFARMWLCSLCGIQHLIVKASPQQEQELRAAMSWCTELGLSMPQSVTIHHVDVEV